MRAVRFLRILPAVAVALATLPAMAAEWAVDPARSEIVFEYERAGAPANGIFADFAGTGSMDAADPSAARLEVMIDTVSIDLYDTMASAFATSAEWFDSKNHPHVIYKLHALKEIEAPVYEAQGTLTIRGKSQPITTQIRLEIGESEAKASGTLKIVRSDYLLGVGPSAAFVEIGPDVAVRFDLTAARAN